MDTSYTTCIKLLFGMLFIPAFIFMIHEPALASNAFAGCPKSETFENYTVGICNVESITSSSNREIKVSLSAVVTTTKSGVVLDGIKSNSIPVSDDVHAATSKGSPLGIHSILSRTFTLTVEKGTYPYIEFDITASISGTEVSEIIAARIEVLEDNSVKLHSPLKTFSDIRYTPTNYVQPHKFDPLHIESASALRKLSGRWTYTNEGKQIGIANAQVRIENIGSRAWTTQTNNFGYFEISIPASWKNPKISLWAVSKHPSGSSLHITNQFDSACKNSDAELNCSGIKVYFSENTIDVTKKTFTINITKDWQPWEIHNTLVQADDFLKSEVSNGALPWHQNNVFKLMVIWKPWYKSVTGPSVSYYETLNRSEDYLISGIHIHNKDVTNPFIIRHEYGHFIMDLLSELGTKEGCSSPHYFEVPHRDSGGEYAPECAWIEAVPTYIAVQIAEQPFIRFTNGETHKVYNFDTYCDCNIAFPSRDALDATEGPIAARLWILSDDFGLVWQTLFSPTYSTSVSTMAEFRRRWYRMEGYKTPFPSCGASMVSASATEVAVELRNITFLPLVGGTCIAPADSLALSRR